MKGKERTNRGKSSRTHRCSEQWRRMLCNRWICHHRSATWRRQCSILNYNCLHRGRRWSRRTLVCRDVRQPGSTHSLERPQRVPPPRRPSRRSPAMSSPHNPWGSSRRSHLRSTSHCRTHRGRNLLHNSRNSRRGRRVHYRSNSRSPLGKSRMSRRPQGRSSHLHSRHHSPPRKSSRSR